tara:strand:+ start:2535 stop:3467 length:933 start_codon:yes stop_codon:yes gene_type:complete
LGISLAVERLTLTQVGKVRILDPQPINLIEVKLALRSDLEDKYIEANGFRIRYIQKGSGRPLICVHGVSLPISADQWTVAIDALSEHSQVYALDLPGWGLSDQPKSGYSFPMWVETIRDFCRQLGLEEVDIAGQSHGGWVAALFAYNYPRIARRLILVGSAGLNPLLPSMAGRKVELPDREALRTHLWREWTDNIEITEAHIDELYRRSRFDGRTEAYQSIQDYVTDLEVRDQYGLRQILPAMQLPILVCWGDDNSGIRVRYGIEAFWLAPNTRLSISYGGDHSSMGFAAPEFERAVREFLTTEELKFAK